MKKLLVTLTILLSFVTSSFALVVDLKVHSEDQARLVAIEIGTMYYLNEKGVKVFDVGEKYAIWLTLLTEETVGNNQKLTINVRLTKPSLVFESKQSIKTTTITFEIPKTSGKVLNSEYTSMVEFGKQKGVELKDQTALDFKIGGKFVADAIISMLGNM